MVASIDDLQLRPVELAQRLLDEPVVFLVGVDQQRVVDRVGGDAHARQDRAALVAAAADAPARAKRRRRPPVPGLAASERSAAARHNVVRAGTAEAAAAAPPPPPVPPMPTIGFAVPLSRESADDPPGALRAPGSCKPAC